MHDYTQIFAYLWKKQLTNYSQIERIYVCCFLNIKILMFLVQWWLIASIFSLRATSWQQLFILISGYVKTVADLKGLVIYFIIYLMRTDILLLRSKALSERLPDLWLDKPGEIMLPYREPQAWHFPEYSTTT